MDLRDSREMGTLFLQSGAKGFTSGLVNILPNKSFAMLEALQNNDWDTVWNIWELALPFEDLRAKYNNGNNVIVIKEALEQSGFPAGAVRPPVSELMKADKEAVSSILKSWGISKLANQV